MAIAQHQANRRLHLAAAAVGCRQFAAAVYGTPQVDRIVSLLRDTDCQPARV